MWKVLFSAKDMPGGPPWKRILEFSVPIPLDNFVQQLYNTANFGHYIGDNALATVGEGLDPPLQFQICYRILYSKTLHF